MLHAGLHVTAKHNMVEVALQVAGCNLAGCQRRGAAAGDLHSRDALDR